MHAIIMLLMAASGAGSPPAPKPPPALVIAYEEVSATCDSLVQNHLPPDGSLPVETETLATKVRRFCSLDLQTIIASSDAWDAIAVPSPDEVRRARQIAPQLPIKGKGPGSSSSGPSGTLNESAILWGVTDFIVGRVRADISDAALSAFASKICGGELHRVLPSVCVLLGTFQQGGTIPGFAALRGAARNDLEGLPLRVAETVADSTDTTAFKDLTRRDLIISALELTHIAYALRLGGGFLNALAAPFDSITPAQFGKDVMSCDATPAATTLYELSAFASILRNVHLDAKASSRWHQLNYGALTLIINIHFDSALTQRWPPRLGGPGCHSLTSTTSGLRDLPAVADVFQRVSDAIDIVRQADSVLTAARKAATSDRDASDARVRYASEVTTTIFDIALIVVRTTPKSSEAAAAVVNQLQQASVATIRGQYGTAMAAVLVAAQSFVDSTHAESAAWLRTLGPAMSVVADVAEAQDADAVTQALNRAAAPRTSYLRKRQEGHIFYFGINAYAGGIYGYERIQGGHSGSHYIGPFIPIGAEFGWRVYPRWWSMGIFASVVDIGALGSYRLTTKDSVQEAPKVGLAQVFSPGFGAVFGLTPLPISLGCMIVSASPQLRSVTAKGVTTNTSVSRHWSGFLALDIPLL